MENTSSAQSEQLLALLAQRVEDQRADLVGRYLGVLREALFSSRAEVRPSALKNIAADEVETLLRFLRQAESSIAKRGEQLQQAGFNARVVLKLSQVTRQFLLDHSENGQIAPLLEIVDSYEMGVVEGFIQSIANTNQIERGKLERVLHALHQRGEG
ncbi:MAG TPA: hypothetical protein VFQ13_26260 [Anaerolineales bacterium]|nr:hypothetical protein [Anaerolineales bacterium]